MQCFGYYRILDNSLSDIEDLSDALIINCSGIINKDTEFESKTSRKDYYLLYVTEGEMSVFIKGEEKKLVAGMGIIYYPNTVYHYRFNKTTPVLTYYWTHFTGSSANSLLQKFGFENEQTFNVGVHNSIIRIFDRISMEIIERKEDFAFLAANYVIEILIKIKRLQSSIKGNLSAERLSISLDYIHKNYNNDISIEELAAMENLSASRYRAVFKDVMGVAPKNYLTTARLRVACELLCQTAISINSIGKMVGYDNQMYFCRIFKQEIKITPRQYRKFYSEIG